MTLLKANDSYYLPCDTNKIFTFSIGSSTIQITPADYIHRFNDHCGSNIKKSLKGLIRLPMTSLRNHCLLYDYKDRRIGVTKRKVPETG